MGRRASFAKLQLSSPGIASSPLPSPSSPRSPASPRNALGSKSPPAAVGSPVGSPGPVAGARFSEGGAEAAAGEQPGPKAPVYERLTQAEVEYKYRLQAFRPF